MSYDNSFSLRVVEYPKTEVVSMECPNCKKNFPNESYFCQHDGQSLEPKKDSVEVSDIIRLFREFTKDSRLIEDDGSTSQSGSGHTIKEDLVEFSKSYSEGLFQLDVDWDSGFNTPPSRYFIKNGQIQNCEVTIIFEEYNEDKLKNI